MNNTSKHQILVVDDEPNVRESLAGFLNNAGYDVSTAENGFDALLQVRRGTPDVIISDLNMPQMSGFEFLSSCADDFLKSRWSRSAVLMSPVIASPGALSPTRSMPKGNISPKSSCALSPN